VNLFTRSNATLAYIAMTLLLGGASSAGFSANFLLQFLGACLIGWCLWGGGAADDAHPGGLPRGLKLFGVAYLVLAVVQFIPLPPGLWGALPGRAPVYRGFEILEAVPPWLTLSLAPWNSLGSLTWWIPALAIFIALRVPDAPEARRLALTIVIVAVLSIALGGMQILNETFYIYSITNFGLGTGFFANSNHQGNFLLVALVLWGAFVADAGKSRVRRVDRLTGTLPAYAVAVLLLIGVLMSGSLACAVLLVVVLVGLAYIHRPAWRVTLPGVVVVGMIGVAGLVALLVWAPVSNDLTREGVLPGISRMEFFSTGLHIARDFAPFGAGLGTIPDLYPSYEDPMRVGTVYVNHLHNDLLEVLAETGLFGLVAIVLFVGWYARTAWRLWTQQRDHVFALAASIIVLVELVHSLGDYPLRTAGLSSMLAMGCAIMLSTRRKAPTETDRRNLHSHQAEKPMLRI
jgi:putative inorganic carbon (hco3(-)) transporter